MKNRTTDLELRELITLGDQLGESDLALRVIKRGGRISDFYAELARRQEIPTGDSVLGITRPAEDAYNLPRLVRSMAERRPDIARHERELSALVADKTGIHANGEWLPFAALARDFNVGTANEAGNLTGSARTSAVADPLRRIFSLAGLGAQFVTGLRADSIFPCFASSSLAAHKTEIAAATDITETTRALNLTARRIAVKMTFSRQAEKQSEAPLHEVIMRQLRVALDEAMLAGVLAGDGVAPNPTGILFDSSVGIVAGGTNGATLTRAHLADIEALPLAANANPGATGWVINSATWKYLRKLQAGTNLPYVIGDDRRLLGHPVVVCNSLPADLVKAGGSNLSGLVFGGDWSQLLVAIFGSGVDITIDPVSQAAEGKVRVVAALHYAFGLKQAGAFAVMKDAALV